MPVALGDIEPYQCEDDADVLNARAHGRDSVAARPRSVLMMEGNQRTTYLPVGCVSAHLVLMTLEPGMDTQDC